MLTITVRLDEKVSTTSQYENRTAGVLIEASNLELHSQEDVLAKTAELFALAKQAVEDQLKPQARKEPDSNGHQGNGSNGNGHPPSNGGNGHSGNGNGHKPYGRPQDPPSPKQRAFLAKLARERKLGAESIREMAFRLTGKDPKAFTKQDMSKFIESLLADSQAA